MFAISDSSVCIAEAIIAKNVNQLVELVRGKLFLFPEFLYK